MSKLQIYTTADLARISGFSKRQLDYWARQGLLTPSLQQASGHGSRRIYTVEDLVKVQVIRRLKQFGWSTQKIRRAVDTVRTVMDDPDPLKNAVFVHGANTLIALCKTKEGERILLDALSASGQQVLGIVLEVMVTDAYSISVESSATEPQKVEAK